MERAHKETSEHARPRHSGFRSGMRADCDDGANQEWERISEDQGD